MKKTLILALLIVTVSIVHAQELNFQVGKSVSKFNFQDSEGIDLQNLQSYFFLVQILVTTSRYMVRVAGFHDARADALKMGQNMSIDEFERLVSALGPEGLSFGKQPESPLQTIASTTRDTIRQTMSGSRR